MPGPGATPGGGGFDGAPDLLIGEISTIRTFDLQADGTLWGLMHFGHAWVAGANTAVCARHDRAGARGCRCGFWSYGHRSGIAEQPAARVVTAVIDNWGRITPGTRGIRSEYAAIQALYLSPQVSDRLVAKVAHRYPDAVVYRDEDAMLVAHPLTELGVFTPTSVTPGQGRGGRQVTRSALFAALVLIVVATVLSHDPQSDGTGHPWASFAVFFLGYMLVRTAVFVVRGARSGGGELLSPARAVVQVNAALLTGILLITFLLPGAPTTTAGLFLLIIAGRLLARRCYIGSVPVRRTPGGLILRAVSPRYRRALTC